jgi:hypothetical protein
MNLCRFVCLSLRGIKLRRAPVLRSTRLPAPIHVWHAGMAQEDLAVPAVWPALALGALSGRRAASGTWDAVGFLKAAKGLEEGKWSGLRMRSVS